MRVCLIRKLAEGKTETQGCRCSNHSEPKRVALLIQHMAAVSYLSYTMRFQ